MTTTEPPTYDDYVRGLDRDYVYELGHRIRSDLDLVKVCAVSYQPGNGTRYDLVFVPIDAIGQIGREMIPTGIRGLDGTIREGWTVVSKVNGSSWAYPFDLGYGQRAHAGYVASHGPGPEEYADASALAALFRSIAGVSIEDARR